MSDFTSEEVAGILRGPGPRSFYDKERKIYVDIEPDADNGFYMILTRNPFYRAADQATFHVKFKEVRT